jgi:hypothetical protein
MGVRGGGGGGKIEPLVGARESRQLVNHREILKIRPKSISTRAIVHTSVSQKNKRDQSFKTYCSYVHTL